MTKLHRATLIAAMGSLLLTACAGGWKHPTKPDTEFSVDWNKCEGDALRDPKLQQGSRYLVTQATERCLMKKGWVIADK